MTGLASRIGRTILAHRPPIHRLASAIDLPIPLTDLVGEQILSLVKLLGLSVENLAELIKAQPLALEDVPHEYERIILAARNSRSIFPSLVGWKESG